MKNNEFKSLIQELNALEKVRVSSEFRDHVENVLIDSLPQKQTKFMSAYLTKLIAMVVLFLGLGSTGLVFASGNARPGELLYPIKRTVENVQIAFTSDPSQKALLKIKYADERIAEIKDTVKNNNPKEVEKIVSDYKSQINDAVTDSKKLSTKSAEVSKTIQQHLITHTKVLQEVESNAPLQAKPSLEKAINFSEKNNAAINSEIKEDTNQDLIHGNENSRINRNQDSKK